MNRSRMGLFVAVRAALPAALLVGIASPALAQKPGGKPAPATAAPAKPPAGQPPAGQPPAGGPTSIDLDTETKPAGGEPATAEPSKPSGGEEGGLSDICQIDPSQCPQINMAEAAKRPIAAQMYAVQQIYALRYHRLEVQPHWAFSLNDQFVSHPGFGGALNFYVTNVLAVGLNGNFYQPFNVDSKFNAELRRSARVAVPLTEYSWNGALNFTYVPMYGKFAGFGDFIFHWDGYVVGGVGAISTRPIAVIDPDNRAFKWKTKVDFNAGLGIRIFFNRWFAATLEVRDYIYNEKLESTTIAATPAAQSCNRGADEACVDKNWFGASKLTNAVQAQLGVSIFLPFSWEYRLPK